MNARASRSSCPVWLPALVAALTLVVAAPARAAFDDIEVAPRARALGGASAGLIGDEYAPFHNPASLAWLDGVTGAASYVRPFGFDFSSQSAASAGFTLPGRLGGVAIGARRFGVSWLGENLTSETTVALAHGIHLLRDSQSELAVGWVLDVYSLDYGRSVTGIDPGSATGVGVGFGATAVVRDRTRVGFQGLNLNNPSLGDQDHQDLRRAVTIGASYQPYAGVETVFDITRELGRDTQYRGGAEFALGELLWLRAGIHTAPNALTAGIGLQHKGVGFDYGFSTGGVLGETHQFGFSYRFSSAGKAAP
jgi:hypothetical protein